MFKLNLKIALRNLWKNKAFTLINAGGLAIGLACCMLLLLYVAYEWSFDRQFRDGDKTYIVFNNQPSSSRVYTHGWTPGALAGDFRQTLPGLKYASHSTYPGSSLISRGRNNFKKQAVFADPEFLKIFSYSFLKGEAEHALDRPDAVVLTASLAKALFGEGNPLGQALKLDATSPLTVTGVIADVPPNNSIQFDCLMSWKLYEQLNPWVEKAGFNNSFCLNVVQLQDNRFFEQANAQVKTVFKRHQNDAISSAFLHPLSHWHLYDAFENGQPAGGKIAQVKMFLTLAFCVLLIACVNFMNLSTARSEKRAREVGVRKAIGSSRGALIGQFMLESVLLALAGMLAAVVFTEISLPYFNRLLNIQLSLKGQDLTFWAGMAGLTVLTGLIAGSYPAFYLSAFDPVKVLKGSAGGAGGALPVRRMLVIFQFVFASCLTICTIVIYQQLNYIKNKPVGYAQENLVQLTAQGRLADPQRLALLKARLLKSGAVSHVSEFSLEMNFGGNNTFSVSWPGNDPENRVQFNRRGTGYDFTRTIGSRMLAGREFSAAYKDSAGVVINEAAARAMGMKDPVGKTVFYGDQQLTVVGLMQDFVMESAYARPAPMIMFPSDQGEVRVILLRLDKGLPTGAALAKIDELVKDMNPDYPVERRFMSEAFAEKFKNVQLLGVLSNWFGGFSIFISCLGLLGLALFMAEQRKKEISVRKVLGAGMSQILVLLNREFILMVTIANVIAFPLAYFVVRSWLSAYDYRIGISVFPFALALGLSLMIALLTVSLQCWKLAKSKPIDALKYE